MAKSRGRRASRSSRRVRGWWRRSRGGLEEGWSPEQISARLRVEYPDDQEMRISHETIYQSLFVQSRGELRRQLTVCLRSARTARKPRGRLDHRGRIPGMVSISERPAEVEDRAVRGTGRVI
jgi:transposase, IS30 family